MDKLRSSTYEAIAAFACSISLTVMKRSLEEMKRLGFFLKMFLVISVKPTATDELFKVNSALKLIFSVIEDQFSGRQRSSK